MVLESVSECVCVAVAVVAGSERSHLSWWRRQRQQHERESERGAHTLVGGRRSGWAHVAARGKGGEKVVAAELGGFPPPGRRRPPPPPPTSLPAPEPVRSRSME